MNITEFNQQVMKEWNEARISHYKDRDLACPSCQSNNLKAAKRLVGEETKLLGVCQECKKAELVLESEDKFQDDCIYRGKLKLAEKR